MDQSKYESAARQSHLHEARSSYESPEQFQGAANELIVGGSTYYRRACTGCARAIVSVTTTRRFCTACTRVIIERNLRRESFVPGEISHKTGTQFKLSDCMD